MVLDLGEEKFARETLQSVSAQVERVPNQGLTFGILHRLSGQEIGKEMEKLISRSTLVVNYLGQVETVRQRANWIRPIRRFSELSESPDNLTVLSLALCRRQVNGPQGSRHRYKSRELLLLSNHQPKYQDFLC